MNVFYVLVRITLEGCKTHQVCNPNSFFTCVTIAKKYLGKNLHNYQECIPVGCVPAARWPYAGVCFPGGGEVCFLGGCLLPGGVWSGGCLLLGGVCFPGGVCSQGVSGPGGLLPGGGGYLLWGGYIPACTETDTPLWTESQTPVKTLPWRNFVAAGNNISWTLVWKIKAKQVQSELHRIGHLLKQSNVSFPTRTPTAKAW